MGEGLLRCFVVPFLIIVFFFVELHLLDVDAIIIKHFFVFISLDTFYGDNAIFIYFFKAFPGLQILF